MSKWKVNRGGPQWLMDGDGRVLGYRDLRGGEHRLPQLAGAWGDSEAIESPAKGAEIKNDLVTGGDIFFGTDGKISAEPSVSIKRYLSGTNLAGAMRDAIADQLAYATLNKGRVRTVDITPGEYTYDGTTVEIPPFMRFSMKGNSVINCNDATNPVFWVRNDLASFAFDQDIDSINNGMVFDGAGGALVIRGNRSAGGAAIRVGNGDGVWGTAYAGALDHLVALCEFHGLKVLLMDQAVQLTNNSGFCNRFYNLRATSNNKGIVTSTGTGRNAYELTTFTDCFMNNQVNSNIELNSAHQLGLVNTSLTFCTNGNIEFNADNAKVHMLGGRVENGPYVSKATGALTKASLHLNDTLLIPTWTGGTTPITSLRKLFQGQHIVKLNGVTFDLNGTIPHDTVYGAPANYYLGDTTTSIHYSNIRAIHTTASAMKNEPLPNANCNRLANSAFPGNITGWTNLSGTGSIAYSTAEFYGGAGSLLASITAGQIRFESDKVPVDAGKYYYGDALIKMLSTPTIVGGIINMRLNWYAADGTTLVSSSAYAVGGYISLAGSWVRSAKGTALAQAPVGARFAAIEFATNAGTTANFHVDDVVLAELA